MYFVYDKDLNDTTLEFEFPNSINGSMYFFDFVTNETGSKIPNILCNGAAGYGALQRQWGTTIRVSPCVSNNRFILIVNIKKDMFFFGWKLG